MEYTGERIIPAHDGKLAQGNIEVHDLMYREFLVAVENKKIIDIACGCGYGTKILAGKAKKVFAYDIDKEAIEFAKEYMCDEKIEYFVGDIRQIPEGTNSVDVVISIETFEHVYEVDKIISEVYRVLKLNGLWCFTTPNGERYPDHNIVPFHIHHYTKKQINMLLDDTFNIYIRETGFEPDSSFYFRKPTFGNFSVYAIKK